MNVAICDDNKSYRDDIRKVCEKVRDRSDISFGICEFESVKAVKKLLSRVDILLLDIEMGDENGISLKNYIEENRLDIIIIFVSGYTDYVMDSFGLNVMGFVQKDDIASALPRMLQKALEMRSESDVYLAGIAVKNIRFVTAEGVYAKLILEDDNSKLHRESMSAIEEKLAGYDFCRIHRSTIVNLAYVDKIDNVQDGGKCAIVGKEHLKISDKYYRTFKDRFSEYCRRKAVY
ncbi:two component transcriptional regulator, LytTR family [Lachnospiraceae bacterium YSD2013]|nr:two component transcriptional regulator, LytTR family [Lachnospiraceae bacterium YSD2013]